MLGHLVQVYLQSARPGHDKAHEEVTRHLHQLSALAQSSTCAGAVTTCRASHHSLKTGNLVPKMGFLAEDKCSNQDNGKHTARVASAVW